MECETCREALSARLDGEAEPVPAADVDAHLEGCAACRSWQDEAMALTRSLRVRAASATPDLAAVVVARGIRRGFGFARPALGAVGVAQLLLGGVQLFGVFGASDVHGAGVHGVAGGHLFNEATAWNLALGLGILCAAWWPRVAGGLLPVLGGFLAVLAPFSVYDLSSGHASATRVLSHVILVVGLVLLIVVHRGRRGPDRRGLPVEDRVVDGVAEVRGGGAERSTRRARSRLRPVGRRAA
ncbi:zf-HC2 domain-containing protein [Saccharothrix violaceirubra]|uniref:Putative anti-sigma-YlaC factor YlaD n=1 Tax=Saccharothrix violaceirubra TaxID=413306 RepID=A0A7W7T4X6_9PSEU|nr:zf-HC2 domain-containing protein [Saccharothrix violaceirubra]MBB4966621.1 putative anti-sigma-YlaC factor YlaD [Saccharothrix violaceirubra]